MVFRIAVAMGVDPLSGVGKGAAVQNVDQVWSAFPAEHLTSKESMK